MITPNERNALLTWARQYGRPFTADRVTYTVSGPTLEAPCPAP